MQVAGAKRVVCGIVAAGLLWWVPSGCGGGAQDGQGSSGSATTADCATTSADALLSVDNDDSNELLAAAVTSDCNEIALYEDNGQVAQAAFALNSGKEVLVEFSDSGDVVAARSEGDTLAVSYNDGLSTARLEYTEESGASSASIFSVSRTRSSAQAESPPFCDQLQQFSELIASGCAQDPGQSYCGNEVAEAAASAATLCASEKIETFEQLEGTSLGDFKQDFALGVNGFITVRPAADRGTTFIGTAEVFGGRPGYEAQWEVLATPPGASASVTQLPGFGAVVDATTDTGGYTFQVSVVDQGGQQAVDEITFDLGDTRFFGVNIVPSTDSAAPGQQITFKAIVQDEVPPGDADSSQTSPTPLFHWTFGDGSTGTGPEVDHAYEASGVYDVYLSVVAGSESDFTDTVQVVVGDESEITDRAGFSVAIAASSETAVPGDRVTLSPIPAGGLGPYEYAWGIVNEDEAQAIALLSEGAGAVNAQALFSDSAVLEALAEGVVMVGVMAVDSAGQVAIDTQPIGIFGSDGGLFAAVEKPLLLKVGELDVLQAFVIGGQGSLSYTWFIEDDPFSPVDDSAELIAPHARSPEIIAHQPGFLGVGLVVTDEAGKRAEAFLGIEVLAEGYGDLFVGFLGPHEVPVSEDAPLLSFIGGGSEPYFCSWHILQPGGGAVVLDPFACFQTTVRFAEPGCAEIELTVEDVEGGRGATLFSVCAGEQFFFECPFDGFCDPQCPGFDPDCDDPCPLDGFCDEHCAIGDPDCFDQGFCAAGDGLCDVFCGDFGPPDPDCDLCGPDGLCVFACPEGEDPDCHREFCLPHDGLCDFGCFPPDPDCTDAFCVPGDGACDFPCPQPDPDCGDSNEEICGTLGLCCAADGFCDLAECPQPDPDCLNCAPDGLCIVACHVPDPDCGDTQVCFADSDCDDFDPCTIDWCAADAVGSVCFHDFDPNCSTDACAHDLDCDDFDPCTIDICQFDDFGSFCVYETTADCGGPCISDAQCDDGDPCTNDVCHFANSSEGFCTHDLNPGCASPIVCLDSCEWPADGECDDGGPGSTTALCPLGTDCSDCGPRDVTDPCGDALCDPGIGEGPATCPMDCFCGNGSCEPDEDPSVCPADCAADAACGDGLCTAGEDVFNCSGDCFCGNQTCDPGEDAAGCPADCSAADSCGDGVCDGSLGEDAATCPGDCAPAGGCGDGICDSAAGETAAMCPADCFCANGVCDADEDCQICPSDCGPCPGSALCGDGVCDVDAGEDCLNCEADCLPCP